MPKKNEVCSWCGEDLGVPIGHRDYEYEMEGHAMECEVLAAERRGDLL